jgi:hypothetical protein
MPAPTTIASSFVVFVPFDCLDLISAWSIFLSDLLFFFRCVPPPLSRGTRQNYPP